MKGDLRWRTRPWHQQHDRKRNTAKPICASIRASYRALLTPLVGVSELARLLKRDPRAARFAVSRGRITRWPDGLFDAEKSLAEWKANTLHERGHDKCNNVLEMAPEHDLPLENERTAEASDYTKARAAVQIFEARLKKLRYQERAKTLVPARDVADAAFRTVSCLREA